jgi:hypothetical protein
MLIVGITMLISLIDSGVAIAIVTILQHFEPRLD